MSVYIDLLEPVAFPNPRWRYPSSCHLFADDIYELHEFARKLGLKKGWFQNHGIVRDSSQQAGIL